MSLNLPKKTWVYAERLYIHIYNPNEFIKLLENFGIEYSNPEYNHFEGYHGTPIPIYKFMSQEDYTFANFMQMVPAYKYLKVLEPIIFDAKVIATTKDNWNYYGEFIKHWYPDLVELLKLAGVDIEESKKKLNYEEEEYIPNQADFLPHAFNDPFLDYLRKEVNESFQHGLFLSVMFLNRKIIEVILARLFEVVFPKLVNGKYDAGNHALWFDVTKNSYHNFGVLLDNLKTQAADFHEDNDLILEWHSLVKPFKNETNSCVHDDYKIPDETYIRSWRIQYIISIGRKLFRKYCNP